MAPSPRIIVAITGASGARYGVAVLDLLRELDVETHLVISRAGARTIREETNLTVEEVTAKAGVSYPAADIGASIASGSFRTMGMIVAPCSIKTASEIAYGTTSSLVSRAADVVLKERRRLVLMLRETPFHTNHLRMLTRLSEAGAVIAPPVPAFYARPQSLDDMVRYSVGRVLDMFDLDSPIDNRWGQG